MTKTAQAKQVRIKWVKSASGYRARQGKTIRALGLKRLQDEVVKEVTPQIQGMISRVSHLVSVTEVS